MKIIVDSIISCESCRDRSITIDRRIEKRTTFKGSFFQHNTISLTYSLTSREDLLTIRFKLLRRIVNIYHEILNLFFLRISLIFIRENNMKGSFEIQANRINAFMEDF